jgi:hypothetical protein
MITVVIIGSGNIAQAIIKACQNTDIDIVGIYSRNREKLVEIAKQNPEATFISGRANLVRDGVVKRVIGKPLVWNRFKKHMTVLHVGALHSSRLFESYGNFDESYKVAGDYEFLLRTKGHLKAIFLDEVCVAMQMGGVSQSSKLPLIESERAKLSHRVRTMLLARLDRLWAEFLLLVRSNIFN